MDITINTPALLFPAISLIMLAYTNRFLALANVIRNLHDRYKDPKEKERISLLGQMKNLKFRLNLIKYMQIFGVLSIAFSIISMYLIYINWMTFAHLAFGASLTMFCVSLLLSLIELIQSTKSLEIELSDL
jgi:ABC-type multidrug transport system permease subunit